MELYTFPLLWYDVIQTAPCLYYTYMDSVGQSSVVQISYNWIKSPISNDWRTNLVRHVQMCTVHVNHSSPETVLLVQLSFQTVFQTHHQTAERNVTLNTSLVTDYFHGTLRQRVAIASKVTTVNCHHISTYLYNSTIVHTRILYRSMHNI